MTHKERFFVTGNGSSWWAPSTIGCAKHLHDIDRSAFKKSEAEKSLLKDVKKLSGKTKNHQFKTLVKGAY